MANFGELRSICHSGNTLEILPWFAKQVMEDDGEFKQLVVYAKSMGLSSLSQWCFSGTSFRTPDAIRAFTAPNNPGQHNLEIVGYIACQDAVRPVTRNVVGDIETDVWVESTLHQSALSVMRRQSVNRSRDFEASSFYFLWDFINRCVSDKLHTNPDEMIRNSLRALNALGYDRNLHNREDIARLRVLTETANTLKSFVDRENSSSAPSRYRENLQLLRITAHDFRIMAWCLMVMSVCVSSPYKATNLYLQSLELLEMDVEFERMKMFSSFEKFTLSQVSWLC